MRLSFEASKKSVCWVVALGVFSGCSMFGSKQQEAVEGALSQGQEQAQEYTENPLADEVFGDEEEYQEEAINTENEVTVADDAMDEGKGAAFFSYTVKKGDNLSLIALRKLDSAVVVLLCVGDPWAAFGYFMLAPISCHVDLHHLTR